MNDAEPPQAPATPPRRDLAIAALLPDVARGFRAAIVTLPPFYLARQLGFRELVWVALGGWLGTLVDPGGTPRSRGKTLATFTVLGAFFLAVGEMIGAHAWLGLAFLAVSAFVTSFFRVLGAAANATGVILAVVVAIAVGGTRGHPLTDALGFAAGSFAATLLSSIVWPVWTHFPVRLASAPVWRALARYAEAMESYLRAGGSADDEGWNEILRKHQPALRAALESAREAALASRARHSGESVLGSNLRTLISSAETQMGLLIALGEVRASSPEMETRKENIFAVLAQRYERLADILATQKLDDTSPVIGPDPAAEHPISKRLLRASAAALRVAHAPSTPAVSPDGLPTLDEGATIASDLRLLRDTLSLRSPFMTHALRVGLAVIVAGIVGHRVSPTHTHWVTITTVIVLQPYPGATLTRGIERVVGTVIGSIVAIGIMFTVQNPIALAAIMFPLLLVAVTTKPRSYRLFTLFLTPVFVLLAERWTTDWAIAIDRCRDAVIGGVVALGAALLFPSREDARLADAILVMLDALQSYANVVIGRGLDGAKSDTRGARRDAGIAIGLAETSLERLLAEPLRSAPAAGDAMLLVTQARRLSSALTMLDVTLESRGTSRLVGGEQEAARVTRAWVDGVLAAARAGARPTTRPPDLSGYGASPGLEHALARIERTAELLAPPVTPSRVPVSP